jgi:hypothetical protein
METMRFAFVFFPFVEDAEKRAVDGVTAAEKENIIYACVSRKVRKVECV